MAASTNSTEQTDTNSNILSRESLYSVTKINWRRYFGILCSLTSVVLFSSSYVAVKYVHSISASQIFQLRCCFQFFIILPFITALRGTINIAESKEKVLFLVAQGIVATLGSACIVMSVERISVGDAVTVSFCSVICTSLFAFIWLGEPFTAADGCFSLLTVSGVILITKPEFIFGSQANGYDFEGIMGIMLALLHSVFAGAAYVMMRKLGKKTHPMITATYFSLAGQLTSSVLIFSTTGYQLPCFHELIFISFYSVGALIAYIALILALQRERAGIVALLQTFEIVVTFILQV